MGVKYKASCLDCSHAFEASDGGGFHFFELHCWECGQVMNVRHDLIREATEQFNQTTDQALKVSGCSTDDLSMPAMDRDTTNRLKATLAEAAHLFDETIEPIIGRCSCGGRFGLHAPVRCPSCKSTNIKQGQGLLHYV